MIYSYTVFDTLALQMCISWNCEREIPTWFQRGQNLLFISSL